jgi:hypothetical protein
MFKVDGVRKATKARSNGDFGTSNFAQFHEQCISSSRRVFGAVEPSNALCGIAAATATE